MSDATPDPDVPAIEMLRTSLLLLDDHLHRAQTLERSAREHLRRTQALGYEIHRSRDRLARYLDARGELPDPGR